MGKKIDGGANGKKSKLKIALYVILGILLLLVVSLVIFVNATLNKINRFDKDEPIESFEGVEYETDEDVGEDTIKQEDITWPDLDELAAVEESEDLDEENIINILLIGQDRQGDQKRQRSDSMMIASINKKDKTVTITSLLRDTYLQISGYQDNRINASYAFGGMELLDDTIERNFGIKIDANVEVDFYGFQTIIDSLGGIDIALKDYEVNHFNYYNNTDKYFVGVNHFTGQEALMYARTRHVGRSDFERTQRQRTIVTTIFNNMKNESPATIYNCINEFFPYVTTDMTNSDMIYYATLILQMDLQEIQTYRIPADGCYSSQTIRGMMVLVPDLEACRRDLREIIYGQ